MMIYPCVASLHVYHFMSHSLVTLDQIAARLALLDRRESELVLELNTLISDKSGIDVALAQLQAVGPHVERLCADIDSPSVTLGLGNQVPDDGLVDRIGRVYQTSERVGQKVRKLDLEIGRVKESVDIVTDVMDLKVCRTRTR